MPGASSSFCPHIPQYFAFWKCHSLPHLGQGQCFVSGLSVFLGFISFTPISPLFGYSNLVVGRAFQDTLSHCFSFSAFSSFEDFFAFMLTNLCIVPIILGSEQLSLAQIHIEMRFLFWERRERGKSLGRLPVGGTEKVPAFTTYMKFQMMEKSVSYTHHAPFEIAVINATG